MIDLNEAAHTSLDVLKVREANGARGISTDEWKMIEHMSDEVEEVSEAYEEYTDCFDEDEPDDICFKELAEEVADVIICAIAFAAKMDIDIEDALRRKMEINEKRANKQGDKL